MRTFFRAVPASDKSDEYRRIVDCELGEFDVTQLWYGQPLVGEIPNSVRLYLDDGPEADYFHAPIGWHIYSERAAKILARRAGSQVQLIRAPLYSARDRRKFSGFRVLNAIRVIGGLDVDQSEVRYDDDERDRIISVGRFVFGTGRVALDADVFRPAEFARATLFSERMVHDFDGRGLRNIGFLEVGFEAEGQI